MTLPATQPKEIPPAITTQPKVVPPTPPKFVPPTQPAIVVPSTQPKVIVPDTTRPGRPGREPTLPGGPIKIDPPKETPKVVEEPKVIAPPTPPVIKEPKRVEPKVEEPKIEPATRPGRSRS